MIFNSLRRIGAPTVLLLALIAGAEIKLAAAVIAEDSFEEYGAGALAGANGGLGWDGAWGAPQGTTIANVVDTSGNPLTFLPAGGSLANGLNRAAEIYASPTTYEIASSRQISGALPSVFYVSYLLRVSAGSWNGINTLTLHLANSATGTDSINYGIRSGTSGQFVIRNGTGTPGANAFTGGTLAVGGTYLLVARISKLDSSGAASSTYDRAEMWLNPTGNDVVNTPNGDARLQLNAGSGLASISHVIIRQAGLEAEDRVRFDRLMIGTTWADVVPLPTDTTAPVVTINSPANNLKYAPGIPVDVLATVTEDWGVSSVQLLTNGVPAGTDNVVPYFFTLNDLPQGLHTLTVVATDTSDNVGSNSVTVLVTNVTGDVTPPSVSITAPANGANFQPGQTVFVTADVTDDVAVAFAEAYVDDVFQGVDSTAPYQFAVPGLTIGLHTVAVRGVDISGNAFTNGINVIVAEPPPSVIAMDSFESYPLGAVAGKNGGTGWLGAWGPPVGNLPIANVVSAGSNPLTFTPDNGLPVIGGTNALEVYSNPLTGGVATSRPITNGLPDVLYVSYLVRVAAGTWGTNSGGGGNTFSVHFSDSADNTSSLNFGIRGAASGNEFMVRNGTGVPVAGAHTGGQVASGTNYLLVARFSKRDGSGAATSTYDRIELWVNPAVDGNDTATNGQARLQLNAGAGLANLTHVFLRQAALEGDDRVWFDHFTVGASWADVIGPTGPPPTRFYSCIALPAFFSGMNLFLTNAEAANLFVWSSPDPGLAVTDWALEGQMVETPLNDNSGLSRYAINVIPATSPVYYLIGATNTPPYSDLPVPVQWLTTPDDVEYTLDSTNTTISTNSILGIAPSQPPVLVVPVFGGVDANSDHTFTLNVSVAVGQTYRLLAATNLVPPVVWEPILTNVSLSTNLTPIVDSNAVSYPSRFYRLVSP